jgi:plasmid stabilization system protein ParE
MRSIVQYTAQRYGERQAVFYTQKIQKALRLIADNPFAGQARPDAGLCLLNAIYAFII